MWSVVVFEPALPGRSIAASISWVLSHHTPMGWYPKPPLNVAAADSFSEWTVTKVASTSRTIVPSRSVPATLDAGTPPPVVSCAHTCRRTFARHDRRIAIRGDGNADSTATHSHTAIGRERAREGTHRSVR